MIEPGPRARPPAGSDIDAAEGINEARAQALGRAGEGLERSLQRYRQHVAAGDLPREVEHHLLDQIAADLYRLLIQRECVGVVAGNLEAIQAVYDIPAGALRRL